MTIENDDENHRCNIRSGTLINMKMNHIRACITGTIPVNNKEYGSKKNMLNGRLANEKVNQCRTWTRRQQST